MVAVVLAGAGYGLFTSLVSWRPGPRDVEVAAAETEIARSSLEGTCYGDSRRRDPLTTRNQRVRNPSRMKPACLRH